MTDTILTPEATAAYPKLFSPALPHKPKPTDKPKHSVTLLFDEAALATPEYAAMTKAVLDCGVAKWGETAFRTMLSEGAVALPFNKDIVTKGYPPEYKTYINIASGEQFPPGVIARDLGPDGKTVAIKDTRAIVSGTKVRASLTVRAYGGPGHQVDGKTIKPGIHFDMRNVQKLGEGVALAIGGGDPNADFAGAPLAPLPVTQAAALPGGAAGEKSLAEMMG